MAFTIPSFAMSNSIDEIIIDSEFQDMFFRKNPEEYKELEALLLREGCRDPLVVWDETGILVDGHNRLSICREHKIPFEVRRISFANREDAMMWMLQNQLARRNLNLFQRVEAVLKFKGFFAIKARANQRAGVSLNSVEGSEGIEADLSQTFVKGIDTNKELAKLAHTSYETVRKVQIILGKANTDELDALRRGNAGFSIDGVFRKYCVKRETAQSFFTQSDKTNGSSVCDSLAPGVPLVIVGGCTLLRGDCFDVLPKLNGMECDAVITDTPMGITDCDWDIKPPLESMWDLLDAMTKPTANFILFGCNRFSFELVQSKMEWYRYDLIWQKNVVAGFLNVNLMPLRNFESIFVFGRPGMQKQTTYNPIKVFDKRNVGKRLGGGLGETQAVYGRTERMVSYSDGWMHPRSILPFDSDNQGIEKLHAAQKPVALMEWLIRTYTNEGDTVLDPFMGSASTAIACMRTGRRFIGVESNEDFFNTAVERLRAFEWLRKTLSIGSVEEDTIKVDGKKTGFSLTALQHARKDLEVESGKPSKKRVWSLPEPDQACGASVSFTKFPGKPLPTSNPSLPKW